MLVFGETWTDALLVSRSLFFFVNQGAVYRGDIMKKLLSVLVIVSMLAISLLGCSQQSQEGAGPDYKDQAFLTDLGKGLEARWAINDNNDETTSESLKKAIQAEKDAIDQYRTAEFEDAKLQELAIKYLNALNDTMDQAEVYSPNNYDSLEAWSKAYDNRTMILNEIVSGYDVTVSSKYQSYLDDLLANGKAVQKTSDNDAIVQGIADSIEIVFESDSYGYVNGKATMTNTSELDFDYIYFDVQLYDAAGTRTDTTYLSVNNWGPGETVVEDVYVGDMVVPATYKIIPDGYSLTK